MRWGNSIAKGKGTMARGDNGVKRNGAARTDLEPYYRLVEMQKQMIELIQQNAQAERACAALRDQLAREVEAMARSRRSLPSRLRHSASDLLKRLLRRNTGPTNLARAFAIGWSQPFVQRGGTPAPQRPGVEARKPSCAVS
jgi:hypothetical protein